MSRRSRNLLDLHQAAVGEQHGSNRKQQQPPPLAQYGADLEKDDSDQRQCRLVVGKNGGDLRDDKGQQKEHHAATHNSHQQRIGKRRGNLAAYRLLLFEKIGQSLQNQCREHRWPRRRQPWRCNFR